MFVAEATGTTLVNGGGPTWPGPHRNLEVSAIEASDSSTCSHSVRGVISCTIDVTRLIVTSAALAVTALAPGVAVFAGAITVVGFTSVMAQVIVPMSSSLSADHECGRVVGTVMSGLLIGILLARTVRSEPVLRQRMLLGALTFGGFSTLWTSLSFLLSGPPFHDGNAVIGLFGLAGVVGAVAASAAGRLADRGYGAHTTTAGIVIMLLSWGILALGKTSAIALVVGIAVLDLGAQGYTSQTRTPSTRWRPRPAAA
jgi:hypothetical protein